MHRLGERARSVEHGGIFGEFFFMNTIARFALISLDCNAGHLDDSENKVSVKVNGEDQ